MSDILNPIKNFTLSIENEHDHELISKICYALSSKERLMIMKELLNSSQNLSILSKTLNIPVSTMSRHLDTLIDAGLIHQAFQPGPKGHTKYYAQEILGFSISLEKSKEDTCSKPEYVVEMPLGMFSHCHIKAPCGMLGAKEKIGGFDNPNCFFLPDRMKAECIWFDGGFISYNFPTDYPHNRILSEITFSFELCSETQYYNNKWPSDITVYINNKEVVTFTSPGDFGGRRGKYTPLYWPITSTQFGLLKRITVNGKGVFVDNYFTTDLVKFDDLMIYEGSAIKLDIGIKDNAQHKGGINLFGKHFGDYPQAIVMMLK